MGHVIFQGKIHYNREQKYIDLKTLLYKTTYVNQTLHKTSFGDTYFKIFFSKITGPNFIQMGFKLKQKYVFSRTTLWISNKVETKNSRVKEIQFVQIKGHTLYEMEMKVR